MPLRQYGILIGTPLSHSMQSPDRDGLWPHYHVAVRVGNELYDCAVDLKSRAQSQLQSRDYRRLNVAAFSSVVARPDGWYELPDEPLGRRDGGALDYCRHPGLQPDVVAAQQGTDWLIESGLNAVKLVEYYFENADRLYVFGQAYLPGENKGVHNVHMNQGDPDPAALPASTPDLERREAAKHYADDGIWQDGGLLFQYNDPPGAFIPPGSLGASGVANEHAKPVGQLGRLSLLLTKFATQSLDTDDEGHPRVAVPSDPAATPVPAGRYP